MQARAVQTALLSATGDATSSTLNILSNPLISLQIAALSKAGVSHFFVEVEQISEPLVQMRDDLRAQDIEVHFVRKLDELAAAAAPGGNICVIAGGIYCGPSFLQELLGQGRPIVPVLENRDDRSGFERINLQHQWSGIAIAPRELIDELADLPEGWSLPSAILRQAIKAGVPSSQMSPDEIDAAGLRFLADQNAADELANSLFDEAAPDGNGAVEKHIFSPLGAWASASHPGIMKRAGSIATFLSLISFISVCFEALFTSGIVSLFALFCIDVGRRHDRLHLGAGRNWWAHLTVFLLAMSLAIAGWHSGELGGLFAALVVAALAICLCFADALSPLTKAAVWAMPSAALVAVVVTGAALFGQLAPTLQIFALVQIAALIVMLARIARLAKQTAT